MEAERTMARVVAKAAVKRTEEGAGPMVAGGWASARMGVRAAARAAVTRAVARAAAARAAVAWGAMEASVAAGAVARSVAAGAEARVAGVRAAARVAAVVERGSGTLPPSL